MPKTAVSRTKAEKNSSQNLSKDTLAVIAIAMGSLMTFALTKYFCTTPCSEEQTIPEISNAEEPRQQQMLLLVPPPLPTLKEFIGMARLAGQGLLSVAIYETLNYLVNGKEAATPDTQVAKLARRKANSEREV